jgi:beta-glucosidase
MGKHQIGLVVNLEPKYPASNSEADQAATRRADAYFNRQYLDPALLGTCPDEELTQVFGEAWQPWSAEALTLTRQPIDFIGINYYTRNVTRFDERSWPQRAAPVRQKQATYTETAWEVFEQGLTDILVQVKKRYGDIPIYITENGAAFYDPPVAEGGRVRDPLRIDYLRNHLTAVHTAIQQGVDVRGYMVWSLFDNLEWSLGFSKRFGIVHVDFESQKRTPKDSARFYSRVIATHGAALSEPP